MPATDTSRLTATSTFRGSAWERWQGATLLVAGLGAIGQRLGTEARRAGASVLAVDPDVGERSNLATQPVEVGTPKAESFVAACARVAPGRARGLRGDVRSLGVGEIARCALILDCTDAAALAPILTRISNGLGLPLLRAALDGSGERELGRVRASHGGAGHACQVCSYAAADLARGRVATPCPGSPADDRPPTLAGGAMAMTIAGIALLQAQRLVGGNDLERALDREIVLDLSSGALFELTLRRSERCISGHERWDPRPIGLSARSTTLGELFDVARAELGADATLEPFANPLCFAAGCPCGASVAAAGTPWCEPPRCASCGARAQWRRELELHRLDFARARALGLLDRTLADLGFPRSGALFIARAGTDRVAHLCLSLDPSTPRFGELP